MDCLSNENQGGKSPFFTLTTNSVKNEDLTPFLFHTCRIPGAYLQKSLNEIATPGNL